MSILFDIILIVIAAFVVYRGYKKGIVKSVMGLVTTVVAVIVAYAFSPYLAATLNENVFLPSVSSGIEGTITSLAEEGDGTTFVEMASEMPDVLSQILKKYQVSEESFAEVAPAADQAGSEGVKGISDFIATPVATIISNVCAFIIVFIAAVIVLKLVTLLISTIFKAPVLRTVDKTAGLVFGIIHALVVLWILSIAIDFGVSAAGSVSPDWFGKEVVENSLVLRFFSGFNPIGFIGGILDYKG